MFIELFPRKDWLPLLLVSGALGCLGAAVILADWAPEIEVVTWGIGLGLLLGWLLARGTASWRLAGLIQLGYALTFTTLYLARLWPGSLLLAEGWLAHSEALVQNWALFSDRMSGWLLAVLSGGRSQETVAFAFGLGVLSWLLTGYVVWSLFRRQQPLSGLTAAAILLALNCYYGRTPLWPLFGYIALAGLLTAVIHFHRFEAEWQQRDSDYSDELRLDMWLQSGAVVMVVVALAVFIPSLNYQAAAQFLRQRPLVQQFEASWDRLFGGVNVALPAPAGVQPAGSLPRTFLIGDPPELRETVVMTAVVQPPPTGNADLRYWYGMNYELYDGRGWAVGRERQQTVAADQPLTLPPKAQTAVVRQRASWLADGRVLRYSLGEPYLFDHETITFWRGAADLSRVQSYSLSYTVESRVSTATAVELRLAGMESVPPVILARYTQLPANLPARVAELARQVAGSAPTAYDQARALEQFLRQYPYSLDVTLPPPETDPVDFFLFDLQRGYCDYYATAMAVMARSLGLPARLVTGYLAEPPDAQGRQIIYANQAHSWVEIYLGEYGWIAFEPTAAFEDGRAIDEGGSAPVAAGISAPPPIPPPDPQKRPWAIWPFLGLLAGLGLLLWLFRRWQQAEAGLDGVQIAYGRLQAAARRLGQPTPPQQTPAEFATALLAHLAATEPPARRWLSEIPAADLVGPIWQLTNLFVARQYGPARPVAEKEALALWRRLRWPLWRPLRRVARTANSSF
jgi:transglutaminase-like putative cysteine protease